MLNYKMVTFTAISMALTVSSGFAAMEKNDLKINQLPKSGHVTLYGTIDDVDNNKEFNLRDSNGDTIDVDLSEHTTLREGDRVRVSGTLANDFLGFGREINSASVTILDEADERAAATRRDDDPYTLSGMKDDAKQAYSNLKQEGKEVFSSNPEGTIDALPENGMVSLRGHVEEVNADDRSFVLKDDTGDTIDVNSDTKLEVSKGDTVVVKGQVKAKLAGLGKEIQATDISIAVNR
jgi:hypothetical protein